MKKRIEKLILAVTCLLACGCTKASAHSGEATLAVQVVNTTADGVQATEKKTVAKAEKKKDSEQKETKQNESITGNETLSTNGKKTETGTKTDSSSNSASSSNTTHGKAESSSSTQKTESNTKTNTETQKPAVTLPTTPAPEPTPEPTPAPAPEPEPVTEDPYVVTSWYGDPSVADIEAYLVANGFDKWMTNHKTFAVSEYGSFDIVMSAKKSFYGSLNEYSQGDSSEIYLYFDHEKGVILSSCPMDNRIYRDGIGYVDFLNAGVITCTANVFMYN